MTTDSPMIIPKEANVLAVCIAGMNRSPKLAEILMGHGYENVDYGGIGFFRGPIKDNERQATQELLESAQWIIVLKQNLIGMFERKYTKRDDQNLIFLDVNEYYMGGPNSGDPRTELEVYDDIRQQIAPHLTD